MRTRLVDADALRAVSPAALSAFARSEGWAKIEPFGAHADVYAGEGRPEILVPRTDRLADYASTVSRLLAIFAQVADQDEMATYRDLVVAGCDVVRVRARGAENDGSVALDAGVEIVAQAREMLLAAACAVRTPQPVYRAGANKEAGEFMRRVRLGQTEQGSFVVTLLAPVPPSLQLPLDPDWADFADDPMGRMVTRRLMEALSASRDAAEKALTGDEAAFERAVSGGVSANLCEAVARLAEHGEGLDVGVTWARTRPAPEGERKIAFSKNDAVILREAARAFRIRQPKADVTLYGTVHKLKRDQADIDGVVTLKAIVEDKMQAVQAILDQANYSVAVHAHDAKRTVVVTGDLERAGQRWRLNNGTIREIATEDSGDLADV